MNLLPLLTGGPLDGWKTYVLGLAMIALGVAGSAWPDVGVAAASYGLAPGTLIVGGLSLIFVRQGITKSGTKP
jgi:hypothetical protein